MDPGQQPIVRGQGKVVDLDQVPTIQEQTGIVFKAIDLGLDTVFFTPDPDSPKDGYFVKIPGVLQGTYTCKECSTVVVRRIFKADVLRRNIARALKCTGCRGVSRLANIGPEKDVPVVYSKRPKEGLENFF